MEEKKSRITGKPRMVFMDCEGELQQATEE